MINQFESLINNDENLLIHTDRLILEPITHNHVPFMLPILQCENLYQFIPIDPPSVEFLHKQYSMWEKRKSFDGKEVWLNWAAKNNNTCEYIGHFQVGWDQKNGFAIAYLVGTAFQKKGFATESLKGVILFLKNKMSAKSIRAWIDSRNTSSINLVKTLGFTCSGFIKNADEFKGSKSDEFIYEINI